VAQQPSGRQSAQGEGIAQVIGSGAATVNIIHIHESTPTRSRPKYLTPAPPPGRVQLLAAGLSTAPGFIVAKEIDFFHLLDLYVETILMG
jgi:hypothetical protein